MLGGQFFQFQHGLCEISPRLVITPHQFLRNLCPLVDRRYRRQPPAEQLKPQGADHKCGHAAQHQNRKQGKYGSIRVQTAINAIRPSRLIPISAKSSHQRRPPGSWCSILRVVGLIGTECRNRSGAVQTGAFARGYISFPKLNSFPSLFPRRHIPGPQVRRATAALGMPPIMPHKIQTPREPVPTEMPG